MFTKLKDYDVEIQWDDRQSMMEGATGRIKVRDNIVEFEHHRRVSVVKVSNGPLSYGEEWYTVGDRRYESFKEMILDLTRP